VRAVTSDPKRCTRCGVEKPLTEYHLKKGRVDGHRSECKQCRYKHDAEHSVELAAARRRYYRENRERMLKQQSTYIRSEKGKAVRRKAGRKYSASAGGRARKRAWLSKEEVKRKIWVRHLVQLAIKQGKLVPQGCSVCGVKAEAHHEDYERPLDVRWLCKSHHLEYHATH